MTILGKLTSLIFMFLSCKFMCCQAPGLEEATVHTQGKSVAFCIALILFQGAIDGILLMVFSKSGGNAPVDMVKKSRYLRRVLYTVHPNGGWPWDF